MLSNPDLDWLPAGNRQLLEAAHRITQGDGPGAVEQLLGLSRQAPWLQPLAMELAGRALRKGLGESRQVPAIRHVDDLTPEALLHRVLEQPAQTLHLQTAAEPALRLAALYQLVWDTHVSLELSLEEQAASPAAAVLIADATLVGDPDGVGIPLNPRDAAAQEPERAVRLTLARSWLLSWHAWPWLPQAAPPRRAPLSTEELPRHWLEARLRTRALLIEERRRLDWAQEVRREREPGLVSIVIPVWGAGAHLATCLEALRDLEGPPPLEILLVDNGNREVRTCEVLAEASGRDGRVRVIHEPENFGFALGCNLGFSASRGGRVLFLNSDARLHPQALTPLLEAVEDPHCRAVQPALLTPDGLIQCLGIVFGPRSPLGLALHAGAPAEAGLLHDRWVPAVTAACMLLRASEFAAVQGFDVGYLNGQEDTDLCLRLRERFGGGCRVASRSRVIHPEGSSPGRYRHIEANRSRLIDRWPTPDSESLERTIEADGLAVSGYRQVDREDRPQWLQAPQPILNRPAGGRSGPAAP